MIVAKPGYKFVVTFTLPSGMKFAAGMVDGYLALIPIPANGALRSVIAWDNTRDLFNFVRAFREENGEENWENLQRLKPDIGQVKISQ